MEFFYRKIRIFLIWSLVIFTACSDASRQANAAKKNVHHNASVVLTKDGFVREELIALFEKLGFKGISRRPDFFVTQLAPVCMRQRGVERWDIQELFSQEQQQVVLSTLSDIGFFEEIVPREKCYDYVVLLGATLSSLRTRVSYMCKLWNSGVRAKAVVFLTGARVLEKFEDRENFIAVDPEKFSINKKWKEPAVFPTTEASLMVELWQQAELPIELKNAPLHVVDVPMQTWPDGTIHRPNTGDTIRYWMNENPVTGSCLFISNQPHVGYQGAVIRRYMRDDFIVETVGSATHKEGQKVGVLIDSLLRWLAFEAFHYGWWNEAALEDFLKK